MRARAEAAFRVLASALKTEQGQSRTCPFLPAAPPLQGMGSIRRVAKNGLQLSLFNEKAYVLLRCGATAGQQGGSGAACLAQLLTADSQTPCPGSPLPLSRLPDS